MYIYLILKVLHIIAADIFVVVSFSICVSLKFNVSFFVLKKQQQKNKIIRDKTKSNLSSAKVVVVSVS